MHSLNFTKQQRDKVRQNMLTIYPTQKEVFVFHPFCENILVSNLGRVKNSVTGNILNSHKNRNGYDCINIKYFNKRMSTMVHRLVMDTFVGLYNGDHPYEVNHIDGNKSNNTLDNLEWVTHQENLQHARDNKLFKGMKGENHPGCKYFKKDVDAVRNLFKQGLGIMEISRKLKIDRNVVSNMIRGKG